MRSTAALWLALAAGCESSGAGDTEDVGSALEGVYAVSRYAVDADGCTTEAEGTWDAPYFEVVVESVFGEDAMLLYPCPSDTDCGGDVLSSFGFDQWDDASASGQAVVTSHAGNDCYLAWIDYTLEGTASGVVARAETFENVEPVAGTSVEDCQATQQTYDGPTACVRSETLEGALP